jgi:hypothetical protein
VKSMVSAVAGMAESRLTARRVHRVSLIILILVMM